MLKKLTNFLLILAVSSSIAVGMPLHSNEQECSMGGEMDCCKTALVQKQTPEVAAARLCCATNCSQSGATPPAASLQLSSQPATAPQLTIVAPRPHNGPKLSYAKDNPPKGLQFSYLLNLALLI